MSRKYSKEEKMHYVEDYRASELSLTKYAEENGIPKTEYDFICRIQICFSISLVTIMQYPSSKISKIVETI